MKVFITLLLILLVFSACQNAKDLFNPHEAPVIEEIVILPTSRVVNPRDTVYLEVQATNPEEGVLSYHWSVSPQGNNFVEGVDKFSTRWVAPLNGGVFTFRVEVSNAYKSVEQSRQVTVLNLEAPVVNISRPADGDFFVQLAEIEIEAEAFHANGISLVQLYVEDSLRSEQSGSGSDSYLFRFTPDTTMVGNTELKIVAIANQIPRASGDSVTVKIQGILPGR